jgi:hypothetical protein
VTACSDEYLESTRLFKVLANEDSRLKTSILHKKQGRLQFVRVRDNKEHVEASLETTWYEAVFHRVSIEADKWMTMYMELKTTYDDLDISYPLNPKDPDPKQRKMALWIHNQRQAKKGKGKGLMNEERIKLLESLKHWRWEEADKWMPMYVELKTDYDDLNIMYPTNIRDPDPKRKKMAKWIEHQRAAKKGKGEHLMNEQRIKLLESLKYWRWEKEDTWTVMYMELKTDYDDLDIDYPLNPKDPDPKRKKMANWIHNQRQHKKGRKQRGKVQYMTQDRITLLEFLKHWKW